MNNGFILLHRKFLKWEWYSNTNDRLVFIHCLLSANWEDGWFEGVKIPRGSFATSYKNLAKEIGISVQSLRTSLKHLKSTNNITHETNKQFSIITINNYNKYQLDNTAINKRLTNEQQTTNNNIINNNERNKEINIKEKYIKRKYGQFENVKLTDEEYQKLKDKFIDYENKIENLSSYIASKGDKYKSHYATILNWARKENKDLPDWFNNEPQRKEIDYERKKLAEAINNGTYKP